MGVTPSWPVEANRGSGPTPVQQGRLQRRIRETQRHIETIVC